MACFEDVNSQGCPDLVVPVVTSALQLGPANTQAP
jgi:hypothetical protein